MHQQTRKPCGRQRLIREESLEAVCQDLGAPAHRLFEWRNMTGQALDRMFTSKYANPSNA